MEKHDKNVKDKTVVVVRENNNEKKVTEINAKDNYIQNIVVDKKIFNEEKVVQVNLIFKKVEKRP